MRKLFYLLTISVCCPFLSMGMDHAIFAGCSDAGTATATADSVCYNDPVTLSLAGYTGTLFQWQQFDGSNWQNETGPGSNTPSYTVSLTLNGLFRAIVTETGCPADTSNTVSITVGTIPVPAANPSGRCGPGTVSLIGSGSGTLDWYDAPSGGNLIASGNSTSAFIAASTTLYVEDKVLGGGGNASPILVTEMDLGNNDYLEIQNVSPLPVDVTGWKVAINNSYTDINSVNANVQVLNGIMQPGDIMTWTDLATSPNYWGSNMLWNPGAFPTFTGWALIIDDQNNPVDFVVLNWPAANIQGAAINVQGVPVPVQSIWSGNGVDITTVPAGNGVQRIGTSDNNVLTDFSILPLNIGATNLNMTIPFTGFGCTSPRVPVQITISPSDSITINASTTAVCQSGSATFTAVSSNPNYNYTWSPATGLNTTTGATVTASPLTTTTYIVTGDDGTCSNVDTVTLEIGAPTVAGTASTFQDTVCLGKSTDLILTGSSGNIQWQHFDGVNWIDETGPGATTAMYTITPTMNMTYRAYLSSGSCPPDSSNSLDIEVLSVSDPITTDTSRCGPGNVVLTAAGQGNLFWYSSPTSPLPINGGSIYTFTASTTTTVYVEAFAGSAYNIGPATSAIGNQTTTASNNAAVGFDVVRPVTIDYVHVYPGQTGNVTINLRQSAGGPILATKTEAVTAFTGKTPIKVDFSVPVGTGYRMEVASGGVTLSQNTTGAVYPYTVANGPLSITGYYNPNFATGGAYLYLYDWIVSEGCRSNRVPATATVNSFPAIPTISQNWNFLTSSSSVGNQWFLNGNPIPGATGQVHEALVVGNYTVSVTINGCTTTSAVYQVTIIGIEEQLNALVSVYPNPVNDKLSVDVGSLGVKVSTVKISDLSGRSVYFMEYSGGLSEEILVVSTDKFRQGVYLLEIITESGTIRNKFTVQR
jgi:hypothetical protein